MRNLAHTCIDQSILPCPACNYAAERERAELMLQRLNGLMTRANAIRARVGVAPHAITVDDIELG